MERVQLTYFNHDAIFALRAETPALLIRRSGAERLMMDPSAFSDEALAQRIQEGEPSWIKELIRRHSPRLLTLIRHMIPSDSGAASAEDILQETWILMLRKLDLFDADRCFKPWITQVAVNCCRQHLRRERFRRIWFVFSPESDPGDAGVADIPQSPDSAIDIQRALMSLSPKLRETIVLKFYGGLTIDEISETLSIPSGTVKSRLSAAMDALKVRLESKGATL
jgi:RNA polymerase sigma factor (sigma-70 family)